jgi:hypothetical protein
MTSNYQLSREIIVSGTIDSFLGLVDIEQLSNPNQAGYVYDKKHSVYLYGPIGNSVSHKKPSIYWLVVTGINIVIDDWRMGSATGTSGPF